MLSLILWQLPSVFGAPWLSDTSLRSLPCLHIKNYFSHICYYQASKIWIQTLKTLHLIPFSLWRNTHVQLTKKLSHLFLFVDHHIFFQRNLYIACILSIRSTRLFQQDIEHWLLHQLWQWLHIRALYPWEISGKKKGKKKKKWNDSPKGSDLQRKKCWIMNLEIQRSNKELGWCSTVEGWGWGSCSLGTGCRSPGSTVPAPHRGRWLRLPAGRLWCVGYYTAP